MTQRRFVATGELVPNPSDGQVRDELSASQLPPIGLREFFDADLFQAITRSGLLARHCPAEIVTRGSCGIERDCDSAAKTMR